MRVVGQIADTGHSISLAARYTGLKEFNPAVINELIEKFVIHSPEKSCGKKHVTIAVYFTQIEKIRIPFVKPELQPETEGPALLLPRRFHQKIFYFLMSLCLLPRPFLQETSTFFHTCLLYTSRCV